MMWVLPNTYSNQGFLKSRVLAPQVSAEKQVPFIHIIWKPDRISPKMFLGKPSVC